MSTSARLFIDPAPEVGAATKRYRIDCKRSVTTLWFSPGPIDFPERHRVSIALQKHADECGRCRLQKLWEQHGDPQLRQMVDEVWDQVQQRQVARHLAGRRN